MSRRNLTIAVDEELARWARVYAARHETSISRMIAELLHKMMLEDEGYQAAMEHFLARRPQRLKKGSARYPTRGDLHER